jgi:hypothetical protein
VGRPCKADDQEQWICCQRKLIMLSANKYSPKYISE